MFVSGGSVLEVVHICGDVFDVVLSVGPTLVSELVSVIASRAILVANPSGGKRGWYLDPVLLLHLRVVLGVGDLGSGWSCDVIT